MDAETRELTRGGRPAHITPMAFRLLQVLIEKRPKAMSKEQLHDFLWPRTFVSDATLTGLVKEVRAAIGDDAKAPRFIRTVAAFGYAFSGESPRSRAPPRAARGSASSGWDEKRPSSTGRTSSAGDPSRCSGSRTTRFRGRMPGSGSPWSPRRSRIFRAKTEPSCGAAASRPANRCRTGTRSASETCRFDSAVSPRQESWSGRELPRSAWTHRRPQQSRRAWIPYRRGRPRPPPEERVAGCSSACRGTPLQGGR